MTDNGGLENSCSLRHFQRQRCQDRYVCVQGRCIIFQGDTGSKLPFIEQFEELKDQITVVLYSTVKLPFALLKYIVCVVTNYTYAEVDDSEERLMLQSLTRPTNLV